MMSFLRRLWSRDRSRDIFRWHDGHGSRRSDPVKVLGQIEDECPELGDLLRVVSDTTELAPGPLRAAARDAQKGAARKLVAVTRKAFGVPDLDDRGRGLTDPEVMALLAAFLIYMGDLAEEARPFETSRPRDAPRPPDSPTG